jgi:hypothetical protein
MTAQHRKSFGSKLLIALALISAVGVTLPTAAARAEDCLAAPNSPAREGTRWLYRLDRATQHKCWYMGAFGQPTQRAGAAAKIVHSALPLAIPLPRPRPSAAEPSLSLSLGSADSSPESLAARPGPTLPVSGATEEIKSRIISQSDPQQALTSSAELAPDAHAPMAPDANAPISVAADGTTSAISETHQVVPSPEANVEATAPTPKAQPPIGTATYKTGPPTSDIAAQQQSAPSSELNAEVAPRTPNAPAQIVATIDDSEPSIPHDSATQLSTSSKLSFNAAEPAPDVSVAEFHAPITVATVNAHPLYAPADLMPDGRERTSTSDESIGVVGMRVPPLYLILAFVVALVGMLYFLLFRYLPGGGARIRTGQPADDYVDDDLYDNPEFYRKLRQGGA